jgi:hypothetical protein
MLTEAPVTDHQPPIDPFGGLVDLQGFLRKPLDTNRWLLQDPLFLPADAPIFPRAVRISFSGAPAWKTPTTHLYNYQR